MNWKKSDALFRYVQLSAKADEFYQENKKEIEEALYDYERYKENKELKR